MSTVSSAGAGPGLVFTVQGMAGCSCEQIIVQLGLGSGRRKHGCSTGTRRDRVAQVGQ